MKLQALARRPPAEPKRPQEETPEERGGHKTVISVLVTVASGLILAGLAVSGIITGVIAVVVFALILVGMLVMHGGAAGLGSGLSDHDGFEQQVEEEEQRRAEEEGEASSEEEN